MPITPTPRYPGLDLPIYDAEAPVATQEQLRDLESIETFTPTTALRTVTGSLHAVPTAPKLETLQELLRTADEELETVAKLCMSKVVGHTWGLLEDPERRHNHHVHEPLSSLVPEGYSLVAEVDIIKNAVPITLRNAHRIFLGGNLGHIATFTGVAQYYWRPEGYYLRDIQSRQFVVGRAVSESQSRRWLVDMDLRLAHS